MDKIDLDNATRRKWILAALAWLPLWTGANLAWGFSVTTPINVDRWNYEMEARIPPPPKYGLNRTMGRQKAQSYVSCTSGYALPQLGRPLLVSMAGPTGLPLLKRPATLFLPRAGCDEVYHVRWVRGDRVRYVHRAKARTTTIKAFARIWRGQHAPAAASKRDYDLARRHWQCQPGRCWSVAATWDSRYGCHTTTRMRDECGPRRAADDRRWWRAQ